MRWRDRLSWVTQGDPKCQSHVGIREVQGDLTQNRTVMWTRRQRLDWCSHRAWTPTEAGRARGGFSPRRTRGSTALPTKLILDYGLQNCERVNFFVFVAPPSRATTRNEYTPQPWQIFTLLCSCRFWGTWFYYSFNRPWSICYWLLSLLLLSFLRVLCILDFWPDLRFSSCWIDAWMNEWMTSDVTSLHCLLDLPSSPWLLWFHILFLHILCFSQAVSTCGFKLGNGFVFLLHIFSCFHLPFKLLKEIHILFNFIKPAEFFQLLSLKNFKPIKT